VNNPGGEFESGSIQSVQQRVWLDPCSQSLLESCPDGLLLLGSDGRTLLGNAQLAHMLGLAHAEELPRTVVGFDAMLAALMEAPDSDDASLAILPSPQSGERRFRLRDGRWLERRHCDWILQGRKLGLMLFWRDVSAMQEACLAAERQRLWMKALMEGLPDPIYFKDAGSRYLGVNSAMAARLGLAHPRDAVGRCDADFFAPAYAQRLAEEERSIMRTGQGIADRQEEEVWADGRTGWIVRTQMPLRDASGSVVGTFGISYDISQQKQTETLIWEQANFDALTGLPNRRMLSDRWEQANKHAQRKGLGMALMMLDLDHFKDVNDTLGHAMGDELLVEVARRIRSVLRDSDVVARLGGDEFCVILTELSATAHVGDIAQKIVSVLARPFQLGQDMVYVSASVGISLYPDDGLEAIDLIKKAETAMRNAKESGPNEIGFFIEAMNQRAREQHGIESGIRLALQRHEFVLHYQPKIDLGSGRVVGAEALVRWQKPGHGWVYPSEFIPVAEDSGLIVALGQWVLRQTCAQLRRWPGTKIAINVAAAQFDRPEFVDDVRTALQDFGVSGERLELELTERQVISDLDGMVRKMHELRALGVQISLDDFGVGQSALGHLLKLPVSVLKVDRMFVQSLHDVAGAPRVLQAIVALAHSLGIRVVAEGVETCEQLGTVRDLGCDLVQGYLTGRPMNPRDAAVLLARPAPTPSTTQAATLPTPGTR